MNRTLILHIKNMVCPRCIDSVKDIFSKMNIETLQVELGEVKTTSPISKEDKQNLKTKIAERGFELLEDQHSKTIAQIKAIIVALVFSV